MLLTNLRWSSIECQQHATPCFRGDANCEHWRKGANFNTLIDCYTSCIINPFRHCLALSHPFTQLQHWSAADPEPLMQQDVYWWCSVCTYTALAPFSRTSNWKAITEETPAFGQDLVFYIIYSSRERMEVHRQGSVKLEYFSEQHCHMCSSLWTVIQNQKGGWLVDWLKVFFLPVAGLPKCSYWVVWEHKSLKIHLNSYWLQAPRRWCSFRRAWVWVYVSTVCSTQVPAVQVGNGKDCGRR